jgi:hypothetical protein
MLQIIGWLGCLYLFVKGLELMGRTNERRELRVASLNSIGFAECLR